MLHESASLIDEGGEALARIGVTLGHGGEVLDVASRAVEHGGDLVHADQTFLSSATRNFVCGLLCPIRQGQDKVKCLQENCDSKINKSSKIHPEHQPSEQIINEEFSREGRSFDGEPVTSEVIESRIDERVTASLLDMGAQLLSAATNILTDIAFIKLKILQGFFSHPDCWLTPKNDNNQCISKLCNYTEYRPKVYMDYNGVCINQARTRIFSVAKVALESTELSSEPFNFVTKYSSMHSKRLTQVHF